MAPHAIPILLVEDTSVHARIVDRCLGDGYNVSVEESAEAALYRLSRDAFDLLIVDWTLPGASGLRLVQTLKQSDRFSELPIIMQTAKDRAEHVRQAVRAGADDYLVKPISCSALRNKVEDVLA